MCNEESATTIKCNSTGSGRDHKRDSDYSIWSATTNTANIAIIASAHKRLSDTASKAAVAAVAQGRAEQQGH